MSRHSNSAPLERHDIVARGGHRRRGFAGVLAEIRATSILDISTSRNPHSRLHVDKTRRVSTIVGALERFALLQRKPPVYDQFDIFEIG